MPASPQDSMVGRALGRYRIVEQIGAGGMGVVYRARDLRLDRDVALKLLPPRTSAGSAADRRFQKEARALSKLNHPNIATIHDFDTEDGVDFVVMELIRGTTLAVRVGSGPLPEWEVAAIGMQIAAALDEAHEQGIVHRDLKPKNIMITPKGQVKVLDFGVAKIVRGASEPDASTTLSDTLQDAAVGTLPYMAPEQLRGRMVDSRTDIWAAGVVLYELATGRLPFAAADAFALISAIAASEPRPPTSLNPELSPALERIILKALDKDPARRYQSARELLVDLQRLDVVTATGLIVPPRRRHLRRPLGWVAAVGLAGLAAWLGGQVWRPPAPVSQRPVVLVGDFENRTGETVFDRTLQELLRTALEQSRYLSVFPPSKVPEVLQRMQRPMDARVDETIGREACAREGLHAVVVGSISPLGSGYVLLARALSPSGETLASAQENASDANRVYAGLDGVVRKLRTDLGEALKDVQESSAALEKVTSASLEAVRYYTLGKEHLYRSSPKEAIAYFTKALELDAGFAMAHEYLGVAYTHINDPVRALQHLQDATRLTDRVTPVEKLKILGDYSLAVGRYDEAVSYYTDLAQARPKDPAPHINLGLAHAGRFEFDKAVAATEAAIRLGSESDVRLKVNLAELSFLRGDARRAVELAREVLGRLPQDRDASVVLARGLVSLGSLAEARRVYEDVVAASGADVQGYLGLADLALATGRYREARTQLEAGLAAADRQQDRTAAARSRLALAELALEEGSPIGSARALEVIRSGADPVLSFLTGRAYARSQMSGEAGKKLGELTSLVKTRETPQLRSLAAMVAAELAMGSNPASAAAAAERAVRYEDSTLARETLARAYAAGGRDVEAIREYVRVLERGNERAATYDAPGFRHVVNIHHQLGVLYQKTGQADQARTLLQTFLRWWADPDRAQASRRMDAQKRLAALR